MTLLQHVKEHSLILIYQTGTKGSIFTPDVAITVDAFGVIPHGNGWYRAYITATFGFGFSQLRTQVYTRGSNGALVHTGNGSDGIFVWGHKLIWCT
ncbi:MAG: hypothetical protein CM15mV28_0290 [Thaumasvirus sp.]|nr:MAG: hypothetical protein CM15mV28_0290 [Thaumasvirus sp.]